MGAITADRFEAGLSNQKLALAGLILDGRAEEKAVALPALLDFEPGAEDHPARPYGEIFDGPALEAAASLPFVSAADERRDPATLFHGLMAEIGAAQERGELAGHPGLALLAAMRPLPDVRDHIEEAHRRFAEAGGRLVCQMRVERDWATYLDTRLAHRLGTSQDLTIDPITIAQKIVASFGVEIGPVLVTCDLKGLPVTPEALAEAVARETGLRLLFKQDLVDWDRSSGPLAASLFDFELMAAAEHIVGTTLSSFFGLASLTRLARSGRPASAWAYNAPGAALLRRTDHGAFANLQRATA